HPSIHGTGWSARSGGKSSDFHGERGFESGRIHFWRYPQVGWKNSSHLPAEPPGPPRGNREGHSQRCFRRRHEELCPKCARAWLSLSPDRRGGAETTKSHWLQS